MVIEDFGDANGHFDCVEEFFLRRIVSHGGITHGTRPNWCHERTYCESFARDQVRDLLEFVFRGFWVGVRMEEEVVDALKFLPVHISGGREFEHPLQADRGFLTFAVAFADETWPHGIVQFWRCVAHDVGWMWVRV